MIKRETRFNFTLEITDTCEVKHTCPLNTANDIRTRKQPQKPDSNANWC